MLQLEADSARRCRAVPASGYKYPARAAAMALHHPQVAQQAFLIPNNTLAKLSSSTSSSYTNQQYVGQVRQLRLR
jgi:hypothetical protein